MDMERTLATLERRIARLEQSQVAVPLRGTSGGGKGMKIDRVKHLPDIPSSGYRIVFWLNSGAGGTGNSRSWGAGEGYTRWEPLDHTSTLDGNPGD